MKNCSEGLAIGGHDGSFLIIDRVGNVDVVIGVRSHAGEVLSVYLMDADIENPMRETRLNHRQIV
jgi:hypothetical protein